MRRWRTWLGVALGLLLLSTLAFFGQRWWVRSENAGRLNAIRADLDRDDPGWRLPELEVTRVNGLPPDDRNVLKLALTAKAAIPPAFEEFQKAHDAAHGWLNDEEINRLPQPEALAEARRTRTKCLAAIDLAFKASAHPAGGVALAITPNPMNTLLPHIQEFRGAAALLHLNTGVLAADKDAAGAVKSCRAELRLAPGLGDEPTLISALVRIAISNMAARAAEQLLAYTEPRAGLAELQDEFLREAESKFLEAGVRGDRAMQDALYDWLAQDSRHLGEMVGNSGNATTPTGVPGWLFSVRIPEEHAIALECANALLGVLRLPTEQWAKRAEAVAHVDRTEHPLAGTLMPAYEKVFEARLRAMAVNRAAAVAIACERFRQANGRWPATLDEIPKAILKAVPADPYTGTPLLYRVVPDGVKIYSVAWDGVDNEGNLSSRTVDHGHDVGIRLWSPAFRRAAPPVVPEPNFSIPDM